jgi:copper chaperone
MMETITLKVEGMTCGGCAKSIKNALNGRDGVKSSEANVDAGTVSVEFDAAVIQQDGLEQAIVDAGFDIAA